MSEPPAQSSSSPTGSRRNNGPTISIENVELLEADRQQDKKRSNRGNRQEEAAAAAVHQPQPNVGGSAFQPNPMVSGGYPAHPQDPPMYYAQQQQQQAHYGMAQPFQNYYAAPPQNPYAFQPQAHQGAAPANEHTGIMPTGPSGAFEGTTSGGYGSLNNVGAPPPPPANHTDVTGSSNRGQGALTIDDIEKSFNSVVNQHYTSIAQEKQQPQKEARPPAPSPTAGIMGAQDKIRTAPSSGGSGGKTPSHRRSGSDASAGRKQHRRSASGGNLPPAGPRSDRSPAASSISRKRPDGPRTRSLSGTFLGGREGGLPLRRSFSRGNSTSDLQSIGGESVASRHSIVSDISKSALFQGVTDEGHVQLHFPYEAIRLVTNRDMEQGTLYMQEIPAAEYEAYHLAAEQATNAWEHHMDHEKKDALPPTYYAISVEDDLYKRVLDEIAESHQMPCGLFFCGHHEDVSHPSVLIAGVAVVILFLAMAYIAFVVQA
mmetsp:Transcript_14212/g.39387  ORF Transcript_14212/g.39387 Transcript_14212/m.39387 type:complete len:487 (+) Transcript_14212:131-1591(+)